ncbi:unnamed protein product, partial [Fusarium graminearum]
SWLTPNLTGCSRLNSGSYGRNNELISTDNRQETTGWNVECNSNSRVRVIFPILFYLHMYLKVTDKDKNPSVHISSTGMTDWCETWVPSLGKTSQDSKSRSVTILVLPEAHGSPKQIGTPSHPLAVRDAVVFSLSGDNDPEIHYHAGQDS